jgi:hypothetical protein
MAVPGSTALAGRQGPPELLSKERVPDGTALAGRGGPQELLSGERLLGSTALELYVSMLIVELSSGEHLLTGTYASKEAWATQRDTG